MTLKITNRVGREGGVSEANCGARPGDCPVRLTCPALREERFVVLKVASQGPGWECLLRGFVFQSI